MSTKFPIYRTLIVKFIATRRWLWRYNRWGKSPYESLNLIAFYHKDLYECIVAHVQIVGELPMCIYDKIFMTKTKYPKESSYLKNGNLRINMVYYYCCVPFAIIQTMKCLWLAKRTHSNEKLQTAVAPSIHPNAKNLATD